MMNVRFCRGDLTESEQAVVSKGFRAHSEEHNAPRYASERVKWLGVDDQDEISAVLTAEVLWDWMYVDELWVSPQSRGAGLGRRLMLLAEEFAMARGLQGIWLWTQSWQAVGFYSHLGFHQFARFDNFPQGHARIGFRKELS